MLSPVSGPRGGAWLGSVAGSCSTARPSSEAGTGSCGSRTSIGRLVVAGDWENTAASCDTGLELGSTDSFLTGGAETEAGGRSHCSGSEGAVVSPAMARMVMTVPCEDWTLTGGQMN